MNYILNENLEPIEATEEEFAIFFVSNERQICTTRFPNEVLVSTVFIGDNGILFETMIFFKEHPQDNMPHYSSNWKNAQDLHSDCVQSVMNFLKEKTNEN